MNSRNYLEINVNTLKVIPSRLYEFNYNPGALIHKHLMFCFAASGWMFELRLIVLMRNVNLTAFFKIIELND